MLAKRRVFSNPISRAIIRSIEKIGKLKRYDFLVVGGGPVGCRTAHFLAKQGHQVAVLERNPSIGDPVCCTGIVSQECRERYHIPPELILQELSSASAFSPGGKVLRLERKETQAVVLNRGAFNAHMACQAMEAGADYLLAHDVTDIRSNPDGIIARVAACGNEEYFEARGVVLACGFGSKLPRKLGLRGSGKWVAGAQIEVEAPRLIEVEVYPGRKVAPGYFAWLVPTGDGAALAGLMAKENANGRLASFLADMKERGRISAVTGKARFRGITIQPARTYTNRVLIAGDAAGQVKPLTGGGIYFGLLCADLAAETLHAAFEAGDFSSTMLSEYQKKWKHLLGSELRLGGWAHSLFARMSDRRIDWVFEQAGRKGLAEAIGSSDHIGFDWHGSAMLQLGKRFLWTHRKAARNSQGVIDG
jgi:digeranylgeranylglycerophospholipid reductase